ncbi:transmembrane protein, putative (macronuclear) [Tetrahymena thermophila SB210]|uniref:Transmembrane protein, putative n=1 Tax=Tetrahymena thermophila (strain SB210) TaxID=312017 RepID=W7XBA3_TETTS|nr:transmembrane protein, putative [Tetrahymena thermophila SB210]EWS76655.1 transmembrane protein, putative [Tetrahymena thermophila SB210]|eukprot:XP_012650823.1 transmembrane protein, putative [Tetrahymena thermophila SB210]
MRILTRNMNSSWKILRIHNEHINQCKKKVKIKMLKRNLQISRNVNKYEQNKIVQFSQQIKTMQKKQPISQLQLQTNKQIIHSSNYIYLYLYILCFQVIILFKTYYINQPSTKIFIYLKIYVSTFLPTYQINECINQLLLK